MKKILFVLFLPLILWLSCEEDLPKDCAGVPGGDAVEDDCGVCDDNSSNDCAEDCAGIWGGSAYYDQCDNCDTDSNNDCIKDCAGVWGGMAVEDECEVCNGDNLSCSDCAGQPNGGAYFDECGNCVTTQDPDCTQDCYGVWGGTAAEDLCQVCNGDNSR